MYTEVAIYTGTVAYCMQFSTVRSLLCKDVKTTPDITFAGKSLQVFSALPAKYGVTHISVATHHTGTAALL